ncbi:MAG: hypothetical protein QG557_503 [Pseudomonadota bacterium]|nr:hypothetical protein [Pseudomonadota bacterium]
MFKKTNLFVVTTLFYAMQSPSFAVGVDVIQQQKMQNEINALKNVVVELDERIKQLEREKAGKAKVGEVATNEAKSDSKSEPNWHDKNAWAMIKEGMSTEKVKSILGRPVRVDDLGNGHQKFVYQGDVAGSGMESGNIEFYENRVYEINIPTF